MNKSTFFEIIYILFTKPTAKNGLPICKNAQKNKKEESALPWQELQRVKPRGTHKLWAECVAEVCCAKRKGSVKRVFQTVKKTKLASPSGCVGAGYGDGCRGILPNGAGGGVP
jgi:hypothetical protein